MRSIAGRRLRLVTLLVLALSLAPLVALAQGVDPASVSQSANPGDTITVNKTVHTPVIPPKPDIVFLSDTTGSMQPAIDNVKANIGSIMSTVLTAQPDAQFAVAEYKDGDPNFCPSDPFAFNLDQAMTNDPTLVTTAMNTWVTDAYGCDHPESQLYALDQLASSSAVGFRSDSTRIVVWWGDAQGHDPALGVSQAGAIAALTAANIRVIAVPVDTPESEVFGGLDSTGQATAITSATGGVLEPTTDPSQVANAILSGLENLPVTVTPTVTSADSHLTISWVPSSQTVTSGDDATFTETIAVASDAPQGTTLSATVDFQLNGASAGSEFTETIEITVNDVTPPAVACAQGTNPSGKNVPGAHASANAGQNPDGFYLLSATDNVDKNAQIYVADSASSFVAGPYASGDVVKITQAPGATPGTKPGTGSVTAFITLKGDAMVYAVDASGNKSTPVDCLVPPPPK